ncbi:histidine kinase-like ATPase [Scheffersomyces xylosifermentans]|uniref:histidine kinase-like ATPase n=1 Tax=Scheffersomyces xylosifermentans TaxID=1304137 RepID=UPI00315CF637
MDNAPPLATPPPASIRKLDDSVINKIAAGEIIIQPANALKEMLENSIDARASSIEILVKDGGMKLLQITDNGHGINREDLPLLCERFATSKLAKFEDLESIMTYGFRGEALASISHISRLSVVTKTADSQLAYKAHYYNGQLASPNFKSTTANVEPKPIAGKDGTQIIVEDLFYNIPSRLKALRSKSEEFSKILDVIGRYAVHSEGVGFNCKKFGESYQILSTRPNLPLKERIRVVFGTSIANDLLDIALDGDETKEEGESAKEKYGLIKVKGAITSSSYDNKKKIQPVFFINNRLVACDPLKRAITSVFQYFLPKGSHPFIYLSLEIDPQNVDVNIHPTKREVRFLHEDEIIELVVDKVHLVLSNVDKSRKFKTQTVLSKTGAAKRPSDEFSPLSEVAVKKYRQENKLVRVDAMQSKLTPFLAEQTRQRYTRNSKADFSQPEEVDEESEESEEDKEESYRSSSRGTSRGTGSSISSVSIPSQRSSVKVNLESIKALKKEVNDEVHKPLTNIFNNAVYVGIVDESRRLCCFQYDIKLFLCDYSSLLYEFFYQVCLAGFCNYGDLTLSESIPLEDLLEPIYTYHQEDKELQDKNTIIERIVEMKDMYEEYFRILVGTNDDGIYCLKSLPMILRDAKPVYSKLPYFLYRLGDRINYEDEKECLQGIMQQIALLYLPEPISVNESPDSQDKKSREALDYALEHVLFPEIKNRFLAPKHLFSDVVQIADLPGLYRVFERC